MRILWEYTKRVLMANRSRTMITIAGIALSFALFTAVLTAVSSGLNYLVEETKLSDGNWHGVIHDLASEEVRELAARPEVETVITVQNQGIVQLEEQTQPYAIIQGIDAEYVEMLNLLIEAGRAPARQTEILLPADLSDVYRIGEEITLETGSRMFDGKILSPSEAVHWEEEEFAAEGSRTFTVTGFYLRRRYLVNMSHMKFFTGKQETSAGETGDVYVRMKHIEEVYDLLDQNYAQYSVEYNNELLRVTGHSRDDINITTMIQGMASVFVLLIVFVSVSLIYNAFAISLGERTKQFGLLKSIGATKQQIGWMILLEAGVLCIIAIPAGLLVGCLGMYGTLQLLEPQFRAMGSSGVSFHTKPAYLIAAVLVGIATVLLSAGIPAIRANRMTPIESIRQNRDVKLSGKALRGGRLKAKLFGVPGMLADKYAKRNRKPYRGIMLSIVTSLILFLVGGGLVSYMEFFLVTSVPENPGDFAFMYEQAVIGEDARKLTEYAAGEERFADYELILKQYVYLDIEDDMRLEKGGQIYVQNFAQYYSAGRGFVGGQMVYVDDAHYLQLLEQAGLPREQFYDAEVPDMIAVNLIKMNYWDQDERHFYSGGIYSRREAENLAVWMLPAVEGMRGGYWEEQENGEVRYLYFDSETGDFALSCTKEQCAAYFPQKVGAVLNLEEIPNYIDAAQPCFLLPLKCVQTWGESIGQSYLYLTAGENLEDGVAACKEMLLQKELPDSMGFYNYTEETNMAQAFASVIRVFMLCFVVILCIIAVANVANSISTSVRLRTREYAMLKSVGMGNRAMTGYMLMENLNYSLKALVIGVLIGIGANYVTFKSLREAVETPFFLPVPYYITAVAAIGVLVFFAVVYTRKKTDGTNICEELRNEVL